MPHFKLESAYPATLRVCGVDEAGRGPWAGPVVAAAVLFPERRMKPRGVHDSKRLDRGTRETLCEKIIKIAAVSVGIATVEEIDMLNIWGATSLAMRRALHRLPVEPHVALIDGNLLPKNLPCEGRTVVKGDGISYSIAAASIIAKVTRDRMMRELSLTYPQYGFESHVGYGTPQHLNAIRAHGPCAIHRKRWPIEQLLQGELFAEPAESDTTWAAWTKRPRRLFPRTLGEAVKSATAPVMKQQGKFYGALKRDWATIVGEERASFLRPLKVQFTGPEQKDAVLHLEVSAAKAPEITYMEAVLLEQMARYFGYRAVTRLVLHPSHTLGAPAAEKATSPVKAAPAPTLPSAMPGEIKSVLARMAQHIK